MSQTELVSREKLFAVLNGLEGEDRQRMEAMLANMGIKIPQRKKQGGYTVQKIKIPNEYFLCWHIKCKLCGFEEDLFFYMKQDKELAALVSEPIYDPQNYTLVNWRIEQKKRETCHRCLSFLRGQPHKEVCEKLVEARKVAVVTPIY